MSVFVIDLGIGYWVDVGVFCVFIEFFYLIDVVLEKCTVELIIFLEVDEF